MDRGQRPVSHLADMLGADAAGGWVDEGPSYVILERAGATFAIDAHGVEAIVTAAPVTRLPHAPPRVAGIAPVRGRMRIVVCPAGHTSEPFARLVLLGGDGQVALAADRVIDVSRDPGRAAVLDEDMLIAP